MLAGDWETGRLLFLIACRNRPAKSGGRLRYDRHMKSKLYLYRFSDGSAVVDDVQAVMASQHAYLNPSIECVSVEDYNG